MTELVPVYTAAQVRAAEEPLLRAGEPLMRRAAAALARVAAHELGAGERVLVLAGAGDNGGDALFAAADLLTGRRDPPLQLDVLLTSARCHGPAFAAAAAAGARRVDLTAVVDAASAYDLVLDGMLGIGGRAGLRGGALAAVEALAGAVRTGRPRVLAVDLPSGLGPDDGSTAGPVLPASVTVTFGAVTAGLVRGSGPELAGSVILVDLGLGPTLPAESDGDHATIAVVVEG